MIEIDIQDEMSIETLRAYAEMLKKQLDKCLDKRSLKPFPQVLPPYSGIYSIVTFGEGRYWYGVSGYKKPIQKFVKFGKYPVVAWAFLPCGIKRIPGYEELLMQGKEDL